jgi:geranylgeranyl diphosphate synthase, type II
LLGHVDFASEMTMRVARAEKALRTLLPPRTSRPARLHAAMRYSMEAGGKRIRPVLVLAAAEACGRGAGRDADPAGAAVAIECVHTYSLIHDDLPCMDDDDLRRGRPTAHRAFDEATALLAGDALLTLAFELLARCYAARPELCSALVAELAHAAGSRRLIGGQMADLLAEGSRRVPSPELDFIHRNKTGAMIEASLVMGGLCAGAGPRVLGLLRRAGRELGLAFQIVDDVLDVTEGTRTLGKTAGKDARAGKATYVSVHGLDAARRAARRHSAVASAAFRRLPGGAPFLAELATTLGVRTR